MYLLFTPALVAVVVIAYIMIRNQWGGNTNV